MRIGFFGGTFDPPHLGHLSVAKAASSAFSLDRVLFAPSALQPLKPGGAVASYEDRLAMVTLLCGSQPAPAHFAASNLDAPRLNTQPNFTVDTLTELRKDLTTEDHLYVILGADAFLGVPQWHSAYKLLKLADWIVVSRPGFTIQNIETLAIPFSQRSHVHLLNGVEESVSATRVRELLRDGSACEGLLTPSVLRYIRDHHLYPFVPEKRG